MNSPTRLKGRTSVASKFITIILIYVLPLVGVTFFFLLRGPNKDIEFARQEVRGDAFLRPLVQLLDTVPSYVRQATPETAAKVEQAIEELQQQQVKNGAALSFSQEALDARGRSDASARSLQEQWFALKNISLKGNPEELSAAASRMLKNVRLAIVHAGDTSNLILDPDLDSYYLMDVVLNALPQAIDRLNSIATAATQASGYSEPERQALRIQAALIEELDLQAVEAKVRYAFTEDKNFRGISPNLRMNTEPPLEGYVALGQQLLTLLRTENSTPAQVAPSAKEAAAAAYRLWLASADELDALLNARISSITTERNSGLGVAIGFLLLSTLISATIFRSIIRPIRGLNEAVIKVGAGDDSARAPVLSRDEIGALAEAFNQMVIERGATRLQLETENRQLQANIQTLLLVVADASDGNLGVRAPVTEGALGNVADALNMMFENVGELISSAKEVSAKVANAAEEIRKSSGELAEGSEKQATHLQETSASVREISLEANSVAETCAEATSAAAKAQEAAERGAAVVREIILAMDSMRESVQANGKKIKRLGERSMEIGGIVRTISDISAQTDMLALNASIEAGRAGEHGRGFSVVAEQVRTLSERAKRATLAIEKLVSDIHAETLEAVTQVELQTTEVERGVKKVAQAGEALNDIVEVSALSKDYVSRISNTAGRQATRTADMLGTVSLVSGIALDSRERVGQTRSTSEDLAALSAELGKQLASFTVEKA